MTDIDTTSYLQTIPGVNRTGDWLPPYALVRLGIEESDGRRQLLLPTEETLSRLFVTSGTATKDGEYADVTWEAIRASYDPASGTPLVGDEWGPVAGSPRLAPTGKGFLITGGEDDESVGVVRVFSAVAVVPSNTFLLRIDPSAITCSGGEFQFTFVRQIENGANISVSGIVYDADSKPAAGVDVYGSTQAINAPRAMTVIDTTDGDGKYSGIVRPYVADDIGGVPRIYVEIAASSKASDYDPGPYKAIVANANALVVNFAEVP